MSSSACSPLRAPQLIHCCGSNYKYNHHLPRIPIPSSTPSFFCKSQFLHVHISENQKKNGAFFSGSKRFHLRKSLNQHEESEVFSQEKNMEVPYSENIDDESDYLGSSSSSPSTSVLSFLCPLLKFFSVNLYW